MQQTIHEIKSLLASSINLGGVDVSRFGEKDPIFTKQGLGLDSLDAMELFLLLQKKYGISFDNIQQAREAFQTLGSLAEFVENNRTL